MKFLSAKLLLVPFLAFNASVANAYMYKITFSTSDFAPQGSPARGTLEGFIVIDESQADSNYTQDTSNAFRAIPNWITQASFTFTNTDGSNAATITRTLESSGELALSQMAWRTSGGTFDASSANFVGQLDRFAFTNDEGEFVNAVPGFLGIGQQVYDEEFVLGGSDAPQAVPGPLPILGLVPFAWHFRKFKKNSIKH